MMAIDKYGRQRKLGDNEVLEDGERLVTGGLLFMDSAQRAVAKQFKRTRLHDGRGNPAGHRPGYIFGLDSNDDARARAYADANAEAEAAWRTPPAKPLPAGAYPSNGARNGDICTINGAPGHLRERDGGLICVPDEQHDAARFDDRERALAEVAARDRDAWRNAR
jgi:hypothetical protein